MSNKCFECFEPKILTFTGFSKLNVWVWQSSAQLSLVCFVRVTTKGHKAQRPPVKSRLQKILLQKGPPYEKGLPKMFLIDLHLILLFEIICIQHIFVFVHDYCDTFCHTRLHLGFSAYLRIWQVSACKMEPQRGIILKEPPNT